MMTPHGYQRVQRRLQHWLAQLRTLTGDDAYERYLAHHQQHHAGCVPMNRREFYHAETQRKWSGVKRCC